MEKHAIKLHSKSDRRERLMRIWEAQGQHCSVCGEWLDPALIFYPADFWTYEHVYPRRRYKGLQGNLLISHFLCNNGKDEREPTGCEVITLLVTNARLGRSLHIRNECYHEDLELPSALALALEKLHIPRHAGS